MVQPNSDEERKMKKYLDESSEDQLCKIGFYVDPGIMELFHEMHSYYYEMVDLKWIEKHFPRGGYPIVYIQRRNGQIIFTSIYDDKRIIPFSEISSLYAKYRSPVFQKLCHIYCL